MYWVFSSSRASRPLGVLFFFSKLLTNFNDFHEFVFAFVNMGPYGRKNSNAFSSESTHQIYSQKCLYTSTGVGWGYLFNLRESEQMEILLGNAEPYSLRKRRVHVCKLRELCSLVWPILN